MIATAAVAYLLYMMCLEICYSGFFANPYFLSYGQALRLADAKHPPDSEIELLCIW